MVTTLFVSLAATTRFVAATIQAMYTRGREVMATAFAGHLVAWWFNFNPRWMQGSWTFLVIVSSYAYLVQRALHKWPQLLVKLLIEYGACIAIVLTAVAVIGFFHMFHSPKTDECELPRLIANKHIRYTDDETCYPNALLAHGQECKVECQYGWGEKSYSTCFLYQYSVMQYFFGSVDACSTYIYKCEYGSFNLRPTLTCQADICAVSGACVH